LQKRACPFKPFPCVFAPAPALPYTPGMQWENLTSPRFLEAVATCRGVAIIPIGVLEPHASHLPLGTDMIEAHWTACRAAEREAAIVFPAYPWGVNHESAHLPGSVVIGRELLFALLENVCDEMGRHGISKIVLLSGHGGNRHFLPLFVQTLVEKDKPYLAYYASPRAAIDAEKVLETRETGHACERETSTSLAIRPDLVRMEHVPPRPFTSLRRNQPLADLGVYSPLDWYAMYPAMYVGDASRATAEKGRVLTEARVEALVRIIAAVKADTATPALLAEFLAGKRNPKPADAWG
jgi:creatinine amidohydrolase